MKNTSSRPAARIETLDILRGVALMGIFIVHGTLIFGGWMMMSPEQRAALPFPHLDPIVVSVVTTVVSDKARTLFAFMFGVSFFLQLRSAEGQNKPFQLLFLRRLAVMLLFGLVHAHFLFGGDILRYYALGGLLLLFAHRWSSRRLLLTGALLTVLVPCAAAIALQALGGGSALMPDWQQVDAAYRSHSILDFFRIEHRMAMLRYHWIVLLMFAAPVAGTFLFGVWMARGQYLQEAEQHRARLKTWAGWGLALGLLGQALGVAMGMVKEPPTHPLMQALFLASLLVVYAGHQALTLCYVCVLTLLCLRPTWRRWLSVLVPAGRMTLTNYILQSILGAVVFYGFGLGVYAWAGPTLALPLILGLGALQILSSTWWLRRFRMGPLEWLWRWMIQGHRPEFRPSSAEVHPSG
jgi:uncharacterized protein